ncbi:hypothetical protein [Dokdonella immobilis]|uniref:Uncharacterized protein n=1 Tax=Dokdonella immobilis TaxID=578942 RepID=A0A1I5BBN7_9GAMM|nr:hypothetical protein [Dokdonella immobilis]SFN71961.1 hypothetical protein SAMN05216289_1616 [Dokdonella immobilis]
MKPVDVELHDALLESASVDYAKKSVSLAVAYYPEAVSSSKRVRANIIFSGVERMSGITDFLELANNRFAGNISHWHPAVGVGTTYIYLTGGLFAVTAKSVKFRVEA